MRLRRLAPAAVLLLVPVLAACGDDKEPAAGTDDPTSEAPTTSDAPTTPASTPAATETTSAPTEEPPAAVAACDLITAGDVGKVMGVSFAAGSPDSEDEKEGAVSWTASECSFEAKDLVEVSVRVAEPAAFASGKVQCPMPAEGDGSVEPRDVAGATEAWWKISPPPNFEGIVRACSTDALVEVDLDYEDGVDYDGDPGEQASQLAAFVLANLQA